MAPARPRGGKNNASANSRAGTGAASARGTPTAGDAEGGPDAASAQETDSDQAALGDEPRAGGSSEHVFHCGMCETVVDDSAIGCDRCNAWFCPSEMCTGLADNAIALISSLREENSVLFVCSGCRVIPGAGAWTEVPNTRSRKSKEKEKLLSYIKSNERKTLPHEVFFASSCFVCILPDGKSNGLTD